MPIKNRLTALCAVLLVTGCAHHTVPTTKSVTQTQNESTDHWQPRPQVVENPPITLDAPVHLQIGRYSYTAAKPTPEQMNPLLTLIDVRLPEDIKTVGQSATYLLQFSGYQLSQTVKHDPKILNLLGRDIPAVHRHFDHVILRDALLALCGNGYRLLIDPINRMVAFERDPHYPGWTTP